MARSATWMSIPVGAIVALVGAAFGMSIIVSAVSNTAIPVGASVVILLAAAGWTIIAGGWLLRDRPANAHVLRLLAWWGGGLFVTYLMASILVQNQSQLGVRIVSPGAVRINSLTVGSAGGLLIGYFYTKANQHAAALARERDRLQREHERLEVLQRMVSHDIRNDMTVILGWSDHLRETATGAQQAVVDRVHTASQHVVELTDLSREYVAVIVDDDSMAMGPVDLTAVLQIEVETCREVYPHAEISVRNDLPRVTVEANELLNSVIRNLINNAVQHNDTAEPTVEISLTELAGERVQVAIADNGPGIPDRQKDVVFGKGELGLESSGTGIGLYLVNVLVTQYGGSVWIEDNLPRGAVALVELPTMASTEPPDLAQSI